jgi:hypothetical protein
MLVRDKVHVDNTHVPRLKAVSGRVGSALYPDAANIPRCALEPTGLMCPQQRKRSLDLCEDLSLDPFFPHVEDADADAMDRAPVGHAEHEPPAENPESVADAPPKEAQESHGKFVCGLTDCA